MNNLKVVLFFVTLMLSSRAIDLKSFNVDLSETTVSGLSAGAYMAVQLHFAFSSSIAGSAIFAGGPFLCAAGTVQDAVTACMSSPEVIIDSVLESAAEVMAKDGYIDSLSNLSGSKSYFYSGQGDTVVFQEVVSKTAAEFEHFGVNVKTEFGINSEHCWPTNDFGNSCTNLGSPYINNCGYKGAWEAFDFMYDNLKAPTGPQVAENVLKFDQNPFATVSGSISMADAGYYYAPTACQQGEKCRLHIALHGCSQTIDDIGLDFVTKLGINEIAEANNIIVLYPQAVSSIYDPINPYGCFDWWGYNSELFPYGPAGASYASKKGIQMEMIWNMAQQMAGIAWAKKGGSSEEN